MQGNSVRMQNIAKKTLMLENFWTVVKFQKNSSKGSYSWRNWLEWMLHLKKLSKRTFRTWKMSGKMVKFGKIDEKNRYNWKNSGENRDIRKKYRENPFELRNSILRYFKE